MLVRVCALDMQQAQVEPGKLAARGLALSVHGPDLYQLQKQRDRKPFPISFVWTVATQLLAAHCELHVSRYISFRLGGAGTHARGPGLYWYHRPPSLCSGRAAHTVNTHGPSHRE